MTCRTNDYEVDDDPTAIDEERLSGVILPPSLDDPLWDDEPITLVMSPAELEHAAALERSDAGRAAHEGIRTPPM